MARAHLRLLALALAASGCQDVAARPIASCVTHGFVQSRQQNAVDKVDLLIEVDDTASMPSAQVRLAAALPHLVTVLTTGDLDGDGVNDFPPVTDLHAGVVTGDMGVGGIPNVPTCMAHPDFGDDGILLAVPRVGSSDCMASYPHFLSFTTGTSATQFTMDFTCLTRTGVGGCGFQQPLDASLKALLPSTNPITFYAGTHGHGDDPSSNQGFLRSNSLVVILDVGAHDDCSTDQTDLWNPASLTYAGDLDLRCARYDQLYPASRFIAGFQSLRPYDPNMVIFAALTGVPEDLVTLPTPTSTIDYAGLLADPRMQSVVVADGGTPHLQPACTNTASGESAPPGLRMARVAQGFSLNGFVQSICADDYRPTMDALIAHVAARLGNVCLPRRLVRVATGLVGCSVVEVIDPTWGGGPQTCGAIHGVDAVPARIDPDGKVHCVAIQFPIDAATRASGLPPPTPTTGGWYYDDFSAETLFNCPAEPQRIVFFRGSDPPPGVTVNLECVERIASGGDAPPGYAEIGTPCEPDTSGTSDEHCNNGRSGSMHLQCELDSRTCQIPCASDSECPTSLSCFSPLGDTRTMPRGPGACPSGTINAAYPMAPTCWCANPICL